MAADFRQFDYGYAENFQRYNQKDPPAYNLSKITAPVALFIGKQDVVATPNVISIIHWTDSTVKIILIVFLLCAERQGAGKQITKRFFVRDIT